MTFPGIGLAGYRSFGADAQYLAPFERVNVLIGPNNSGKSTSLEFFARHLTDVGNALASSGGFSLPSDCRRRIEGEDPAPFRVAWPIDPAQIRVPSSPPLARF